jgi:hypothetical protein
MNLLYRYITQSQVEAGRPHLSPRARDPDAAHPARRPHRQPAGTARQLTAACPEMTSLAGLGRDFAALLKPDPCE